MLSWLKNQLYNFSLLVGQFKSSLSDLKGLIQDEFKKLKDEMSLKYAKIKLMSNEINQNHKIQIEALKSDSSDVKKNQSKKIADLEKSSIFDFYFF